MIFHIVLMCFCFFGACFGQIESPKPIFAAAAVFNARNPPRFRAEQACGVSDAPSTGRIIQGGLAGQREFPWQVYLYSDAGSCGGSIITQDWILTAAHCVPNPATNKQVNVCVGTNNYNSCKKNIKSAKIIAHSGYTFDTSGKTYPHDMAMVKLSESLTYDSSIRPVCLPSGESDRLKVGDDIEICGWGNVDIKNDSPDLKKAWMKVVETSQCMDDPSFKLICFKTAGSTKSPNGRACTGDSGGYAGVRDANGQATQYGVASFVAYEGGCLEPNAYSDVALYLDWIDQQIENN